MGMTNFDTSAMGKITEIEVMGMTIPGMMKIAIILFVVVVFVSIIIKAAQDEGYM